jgi:hypothetical protein
MRRKDNQWRSLLVNASKDIGNLQLEMDGKPKEIISKSNNKEIGSPFFW